MDGFQQKLPSKVCKRPAAVQPCSKRQKTNASEILQTKTVEVSERRLKQYKSGVNGSGFIPMTVGLTGTRAGDVLRGVASASGGDTANVTLRIVSGVVAAPAIIRRSVEAEVGRENVIASVAHHFNMSRAAAELRYADCPVAETPNHHPLGAGCAHSIDDDCDCEPAARFQILSQGVWQEFAEAHGHGDELRAIVEEQRVVCWRDVLKLMYIRGQPDGKKLILRPRLFEIVIGPVEVLPSDPRMLGEGAAELCIDAMLLCGDSGDGGDVGSVYDIDGHLIRLPKAATVAFARDQVVRAVMDALGGVLIGDVVHEEAVQKCVNILRCFSAGGLKSCLQKAIRFRAAYVDFGGNVGQLPAAIVAAAAAGLLFADKGSFSPELQLFTRGCTAAFKRTSIILLEDAWIDNADKMIEHSVLALVAFAHATKHMVDYEPPYASIVATLRLVAQAALSPCMIAWRGTDRIDRRSTVTQAGVLALRRAASLLRQVRSFSGDMDMFDTVADLAASGGAAGSLPLIHTEDQPRIMPICHVVDQHTFRGIAHPFRCDAATFADRFDAIFQICTGFNPRRQNLKTFEQDAMLSHIRFAQECCLRFTLKAPRRVLPSLSGTSVDLCVPLDSGVLAAAVGPVPVQVSADGGRRREVLVLLGIGAPEEETVMLKPARTTRDLFGALNEQERAQAIAEARKRSFVVTSPLLSGSHTVKFKDNAWYLDGRNWADVVAAGCKLQVPVVEPPDWAVGPNPDFGAILQSDAALWDALTTQAEGIASNAQDAVIGLLQASKYAISLRALSVLRKQCVTVDLPTPSLTGGLGSDQMAAYDDDWHVYRLLALLSRLVPAALRPTMPPCFAVRNVPLLRVLEGWMLAGTHRGQICSGLTADAIHANTWVGHPLWREMEGAKQRLMEHQRAAIARMHERDAGTSAGHFLIMDTGHGKTVTSLVYAYRWLCQNGHSVKRILWITPAGTVANLLTQLRATWAAPVFEVPRISNAKTMKTGSMALLAMKDYHINVIHADHLRTAITNGLAEEAASSFIIFDEVDEMYAPTLRTSAARRLCQLCPKFVAQTATPLRRNESQLLVWLSDTCDFPVTHSNWLVAASGMVSIQLELGITAVEEEVLLPMDDEVRNACKALLTSRSWLEMARVVQAASDAAMSNHAVAMARADRAKYTGGGVLLVADNLQHAERLIGLCQQKGVQAGGFSDLEAPDTNKYGVIVVTKSNDRGYNSAARLGALVTGSYAGNGSARHQMRGRLRRMGQRRKEVRFVTVVMENSLLHLLHKRHSMVDCMNISLEQLGQHFSAEVFQGLQK